MGNESTGQVTLLINSVGTGVSFFARGSGSVEVTDNSINVTGLSYTGSHTISVVATSAVCPGVLNSNITYVTVMFNIRSEWKLFLFVLH